MVSTLYDTTHGLKQGSPLYAALYNLTGQWFMDRPSVLVNRTGPI